jgi:hypothetical protein
MRNGRMILFILMLVEAAFLPIVARAQPSAAEALSAMDFSAADKQRILNGEFVSGDVKAVSDRDLSLSLGFLVKTSPDALATDVLAGTLSKSDDQITARGEISRAGSLQDFAGLSLQPGGSAAAKAYLDAAAGEKLNLDAGEIAAFKALAGSGDPVQAVEQQLRAMLLARYLEYRAAGLHGIRPYDRGGSTSDAGGDLAKASEAPLLKKFFPAMQQVLAGYPQATVPGLTENLFWVNYKIDDQPTYALTHVLSAPEGAARVVVQRQYYVGRGYNAEQAVAGFLPVQEGTLVVYGTHTFTDQVAGFGGSAKRSIGRRMMGTQLEASFKKARAAAEAQ